MIPYARQTIDDDDIRAVVRVLRSEYLTTGPVVKEFESELSRITDSEYAVSCSSGTAALHLAAMALKLGPGDAVIVPAVTFLATANSIRFTGAEVVFSDVNSDTGLMEAHHFQEALERTESLRPKAVFPVDLNGQCVNLPAIAKIAEEKSMSVVVDSCHSLGGSYEGSSSKLVPVGSNDSSIMTCFSFHPVKTIAMGEGGAVTTNDPKIADCLYLLRNHGMTRDHTKFVQSEEGFSSDGEPQPWYYEMVDLGYNYRASDIHCALGLSQLEKLNLFVDRRRALVSLYDELLSAYAPVLKPVSRSGTCQAAWHLYPVLIDFHAVEKERADVVRSLQNSGIGTQVHYFPVNRQPYYRKRYGDTNLPGADGYYERELSLPLYPSMTDEQVHRVVKVLVMELGL